MQTNHDTFSEAAKQCARLKAAHAGMAKDTPEEEGVFYAWTDALEAAIAEPVSTARDLLTKLDMLAAFQANSSLWADCTEDTVKRQVDVLAADVRRVLSAQQSIPTPPPFRPNNSPKATMPDGGTYRDEPRQWARRVFDWASEVETAEGLLIDVARTLQLVEENMSPLESEGGALSIALDRLRQVRGNLGELKGEIYPFAGVAKDDAQPEQQPAPVVGSGSQEKPSGEDPGAMREPTRADLFPAALARYRRASALRERLRHAYGTEEADAAISHECDRYQQAMHTEAVTVADVLAKLELFEEYRCDDGGSMDREIEGEIGAAFADVRNVLKATAPEVSPAFAARVQAWRELRDAYNAAQEGDNPSDAVMDPLHIAKMDAYNALLDEPVQTFGDVLAMARTIKEEDHLGTESASYYEPAFDALLAAVETLAGEDSEQ